MKSLSKTESLWSMRPSPLILKLEPMETCDNTDAPARNRPVAMMENADPMFTEALIDMELPIEKKSITLKDSPCTFEKTDKPDPSRAAQRIDSDDPNPK
jgi:hypothetical protein